ncbi:PKD domain-containing protein [Algoriphagus sp. D3-2-R+10]|uniref:PKD domain-containing protein n=1 Tax=Algoriphagus aurantiacus TaxID=3103948 RepID=UPI002B3E5E31|nr:PKD domain-containing protein [Algoriphagus sp. D3-2-R+10]MEB2774057.1 PKD domain-containing protein [Algoriphagus sp. D3-2-R+10]
MKTSSIPVFILMMVCMLYLLWSCKDDDTLPSANFSVQNDNCQAPCTLIFNNLSSNAISYDWDFGDGSSSTDQNPTHEYLESGEYTVVLTVTGTVGGDNSSKNVLILSDPVSIAGIFPNSNPVGGPVLIEGEGFNDKTEVFFNNQKATIEERTPTILTTKVPAGLGATTVTLRVENNSIQFAEQPFDVLGNFPTDLPVGAPNVMIPSGGITTPISFATSTFDFIKVMNVYDTTHTVELLFSINSSDPEDFERTSREAITVNGEFYLSPVSFDGDPLYDFTDRDDPTVPKMEIKRTQSDPTGHPFKDDELSGTFITIEDFDFPEEALLYTQGIFTDNFLLLTSNQTGRQYLFVVLCFSFSDECD